MTFFSLLGSYKETPYMYGHFQHLKQLLPGVEKLRFFMDQESGIRAACLSAFRDEIINRQCDAFYVSINHQKIIDERRQARDDGKDLIKAYQHAHPGMSYSQAKLEILRGRLQQMAVYGQYKDRWFTHPFPTVAEPEKKVCFLTDFNDYTIDHLAWLYNKASLVGINVFFQSLRRKLSMLERPISTPSGLGKKWYGYSPYNPAIINKILLIYRVWHNYVKKRRRAKITPAMKLGLAKGPVDIEKIIYGQTISERRRGRYYLNNEKPKRTRSFLYNPEPLQDSDVKPLATEHNRDLEDNNDDHTVPADIKTVYLDTETTGIETNAEIVEIAVVDDMGNKLVNSLVKSSIPISLGATKVNGITTDMISKAPTLSDLEDKIVDAVNGKRLVIYASHFDTRYLTERINNAAAVINCCMVRFSRYLSALNLNEHDEWVSLKTASKFVDHKWYGKHHRALGDALACRSVWLYMEENPI